MSLDVGVLNVSLEAETNNFLKQFAGALKMVDQFASQVKRASAQVAQVSTVLTAVSGAAIALASTVDGPTKTAMEGLKKNTELLAVQVADTLIPAIKTLSQMVHDGAQAFANLSPGVKSAISNFAVVAVQVGVAAKVLSMLAGLVASSAGAISAMASAIAAIGIGPLIGIVVAVGLIIAAVVLWHKAWRQHSDAIMEAVKDVVDFIGETFGEVFKFLADQLKRSMTVFELWIFHILDGVDALQKLSGINLVDVGGLKEGIHGLAADLGNGEFFKVALKFGKDAGSQMVEGFASEIGRMKDELMKALGMDGKAKNKMIDLGRGQAKGGAWLPPELAGAYGVGGASATTEGMAAARDRMEALRATHLSGYENSTGMRDARGHFDSTQREQESLRAARDSAPGGFGRMLQSGGSALGGGLGAAIQSVGKVFTDAAQFLNPIMEELGSVFKSIGSQVAGGLAVAGKVLASKLGDLGNVVNSVVQGAQEGGAFGAIAAAVTELLSRTQAFQGVTDVVGGVMQTLVTSMEPIAGVLSDVISTLLAAIVPVIQAIMTAVAPILQVLAEALMALAPMFQLVAILFKGLAPVFGLIADVLKILEPIFKGLFYVIYAVVGAVIGVLWALLQVWNGFIEGVASIVQFVLNIITLGLAQGMAQEVADGIRKAKGDSSGLTGALDELSQTSFDSAAATQERTKADLAAAGASQQTAETMKAVSESLTNIPSGFKVAAARFDATAIDGGPGLGTAMAFDGGAQGGLVMSGNTISIYANDPEKFMADLSAMAARDSFRQTGNPASRFNFGG